MSGGSFSHLSYHVGDDWRVRCSTYADTTPILSIDGGPSTVSISTRGRVADEDAVEFARVLVREAQKFADEMQRMHAAHLDGDANADADNASTDKAAGSDAA
jgi:hypothetical protein